VGEEGVYRVSAAVSPLAAELVGGTDVPYPGVFLESLVYHVFEGFRHCAGEGDASVTRGVQFIFLLSLVDGFDERPGPRARGASPCPYSLE
jgi:hypothetical protein